MESGAGQVEKSFSEWRSSEAVKVIDEGINNPGWKE
jgi:hypothetical protein